jgi:hypothetical protein
MFLKQELRGALVKFDTFREVELGIIGKLQMGETYLESLVIGDNTAGENLFVWFLDLPPLHS